MWTARIVGGLVWTDWDSCMRWKEETANPIRHWGKEEKRRGGSLLFSRDKERSCGACSERTDCTFSCWQTAHCCTWEGGRHSHRDQGHWRQPRVLVELTACPRRKGAVDTDQLCFTTLLTQELVRDHLPKPHYLFYLRDSVVCKSILVSILKRTVT